MALKIVSWKLGGADADPKMIAARIISNFAVDPNAPLSWASTPANPDFLSFSDGLENQIIKFLMLLDADEPSARRPTSEALSLTSESGKNLLHLASALGFGQLISDLISRGIPLNERDTNGFTALHFATFYGMNECARVLVDAGADTDIVDAHGRPAREVPAGLDPGAESRLEESLEARFAELSVGSASSKAPRTPKTNVISKSTQNAYTKITNDVVPYTYLDPFLDTCILSQDTPNDFSDVTTAFDPSATATGAWSRSEIMTKYSELENKVYYLLGRCARSIASFERSPGAHAVPENMWDLLGFRLTFDEESIFYALLSIYTRHVYLRLLQSAEAHLVSVPIVIDGESPKVFECDC